MRSLKFVLPFLCLPFLPAIHNRVITAQSVLSRADILNKTPITEGKTSIGMKKELVRSTIGYFSYTGYDIEVKKDRIKKEPIDTGVPAIYGISMQEVIIIEKARIVNAARDETKGYEDIVYCLTDTGYLLVIDTKTFEAPNKIRLNDEIADVRNPVLTVTNNGRNQIVTIEDSRESNSREDSRKQILEITSDLTLASSQL